MPMEVNRNPNPLIDQSFQLNCHISFRQWNSDATNITLNFGWTSTTSKSVGSE
ncbi:hypothetical protein Hdeb2414_s0002g00077631 [Helianthus debilis subsp. tardiflorus]